MNNELFASELIKQFAGIWPSLRSTMQPGDIYEYQLQMVAALTENNLNNLESVQQGFKNARTKGGQFPPSVPEFVRWCQPKAKNKAPEYFIAPPNYSLTDEQRANFSMMTKNLLEQMK